MLSPEQMDAIVRSYVTVSDRIRALDAAGVSQADIARFLGKRYQHVRNVLEGDRLQAPPPVAPTGVEDKGTPFEHDDHLIEDRGNGAYRLVVRPDGSVMLPPAVRSAFEVEGGGVVMAKLDGDTFGLISAETAMERVRAMIRKYVPPGVSLADELVAERHAQAAAEEAE